MSRIELAAELGENFDRILEHLAAHQVDNPALRLREIVEAIDVLEHNPFIGRVATSDLRELVIGHRAHCYVALYRYVAEVDTVFVLAVRGQREAGFSRL